MTLDAAFLTGWLNTILEQYDQAITDPTEDAETIDDGETRWEVRR